MNTILFDAKERANLLPLTYTKPVAELRVGILKIIEKWNLHLKTECSFLTQDYLQEKFPAKIEDQNLLINGALLPDADIVEQIKNLKNREALTKDDELLAINLQKDDLLAFFSGKLEEYNNTEYDAEIYSIENSWDIFSLNGEEIEADYDLLTKDRKSQKISSTVQVLGKEQIFFEEGAKAEFVTLNATEGPIYIGKDAEIMEGSVIRGPFALCEHSTVKMSSKIYGPTTIGPESKVGGELNNVVIQGFTNKAHDGFLGNSVIGEWCNLGADTNNSNLKNNYAEVRLWNYNTEGFAKTGLQFCGLIMGDHSKCGINTMFNTGTVVGVSANIFGSGFPRNFIPSYSWGGASGFTEYQTKKAFEVAAKVFERRGLKFDEKEEKILTHIFNQTKKYRK
jgi:UDP-N-acetylglucosamine diphosphorylase/glucosamine-1-phosphate N-acetyltransferase